MADKIMQGDKTLQTAKEYLGLENADKRSDALVAQFKKDPTALTATERTELNSYIRLYAAEMQTQHGDAVTQELITGMLTGSDYLKSAPNTDAQNKAHTIMNTWGYHMSNASMGDPALLFGLGPLGRSIKVGMVGNATIGVSANTGVQLSGDDPFSYVDAVMAGVTAAATTGKRFLPSVGMNMGGAALGSAAKGEDPISAVMGAGAGTIAGRFGGKSIDIIAPISNQVARDVIGATTGSIASELTGNAIKEEYERRINH